MTDLLDPKRGQLPARVIDMFGIGAAWPQLRGGQ